MVVRCAVLGDPVEHSLSPVLHRAGYAALGLSDHAYDRVRVPGGTLAPFLDGLGPEWRGLSLTMPLKRELLPLADVVSDVARLAGAANTLVLADGVRSADNTDVPGLSAAIRERYSGPLDTATILGGGATAASAGLALAGLGCASITVLARDPDRAAETVATVSAHPSRPRVRLRPLDPSHLGGGSAGVAAVVSTIPVEAQTPALVASSVGAAVVVDVVYDPWPTPLMLAAPGPVVTGLDLLAHQARLQFALFTGYEVDVEVLRAAGLAALAAR